MKHIQRTKFLIHLVDGSEDNIIKKIIQINNELKAFDDELVKKPQILCINKYDLDYVVVSYESMILYKEEYLNEILKVLELNILDSIDIHNGNQKYYD